MMKDRRNEQSAIATICIAGMVITMILALLTGCTSVTWKALDGTELSSFSVLSNKKLSGSLSDDGKTRILIINEFENDGISGAAAITKAAVEGAVKGIKP